MKKAGKVLLALIIGVLLVITDYYLAHTNFIANSNIFVKNDFEITQQNHPEKVKVLVLWLILSYPFPHFSCILYKYSR